MSGKSRGVPWEEIVDEPGTEVQPDHAPGTWNILAGQVQAFIKAWEAGGDIPDLDQFVTAGPTGQRRLMLVELIKVDLNYRWSRGREPRKIEDYLAAFPELAQGGPPCDLLYEEFHVRKRAGEAVEPRDYQQRFPDQAAELGRLLGLEAPHLSTSLIGGQQLQEIEVGGKVDDFDLFALLGKGAFARVFLARQRSMQRLVALKVSADAGEEPQTLAQLDHPHIVRVYDQRLVPKEGLRLLYMQFVPGGTLQAVIELMRKTPQVERSGRTLLRAVDAALEERGETSPVGSALRGRLAVWTWPETVCWLGARLAEALDYAQRQEVLHRDVKPANVLLTAEGAPKLADFNVSFSCKLDGASPAAFFGGSLSYMSPEQIEAFNPAHPRNAGDLDGRSDLYSLCIILWELLAGRRPFRDDGLDRAWAAMLAQMTERRRAGVDPTQTPLPAGNLPAGLQQVLLSGLDPDPARRPQTGAVLARELELCLQPHARDLLHPPEGGWRSFVRRRGLVCLLLATVAPNAAAAIFNFSYNRSEIIGRMSGAEPVFWNVQFAINGIAFPLGVACLGVLVRPAARAVRQVDKGEPLDADLLPPPRRRCLALGDWAAGLSIALWLLAGPLYPLALWAVLGSLPVWFIMDFVVSLALCGLIASVYPFFGVTFLTVRALFPILARGGNLDAGDLTGMERLKRRTGWYLLLSAVAPMLTVAAWAAMGSENRMALGVLSAVSLAGLAAAFVLSRAIQGDLEALTRTAVSAFPTTEGAASPSQVGLKS
jgi:eukaryotic-like serine/threonine-protein kinase